MDEKAPANATNPAIPANQPPTVLTSSGLTIRIVSVTVFQRAAAEIGGEIIITAEQKKNALDEAEQAKLNSRVKSLQGTEKNLKALIKKLSALHFRKQVVEFSAQGSGTLGINGAQWDEQPWALACKNGVVDLKSGGLRIGSPEDYIKSPCPTEYKSNAECPRFYKFLFEIFVEDQGLVAFVQRVIGMGLIGSSFQKQYLIVLSGQGRNGEVPRDSPVKLLSLNQCLTPSFFLFYLP